MVRSDPVVGERMASGAAPVELLAARRVAACACSGCRGKRKGDGEHATQHGLRNEGYRHRVFAERVSQDGPMHRLVAQDACRRLRQVAIAE